MWYSNNLFQKLKEVQSLVLQKESSNLLQILYVVTLLLALQQLELAPLVFLQVWQLFVNGKQREKQLNGKKGK